MEQGLEYKQPGSRVYVLNHYTILYFTCIIFFKSHSNQWGRSCCCCLVSELCLTLLGPHGLQPTSLCPRDFPDKNTGVGSHFLLQRIFPTQGSICIGRRILYHRATWEAHQVLYCPPIDRGRNWGMVKLNLLPKVTDFKWQCRKSKLGSPISYAKPPLFSTALMLTFFLIRSENMLHFLRNPTWRSKVSPGVKAGMRLWARESYSRGDVTWGNRSRSDHEGNERNQQRYTDIYEGKKSENY